MFCNQAKEYLSQMGVDFAERDVTQDAKALADLQEWGIFSTPVIVIGGERIVGFDRDKIDQELG